MLESIRLNKELRKLEYGSAEFKKISKQADKYERYASEGIPKDKFLSEYLKMDYKNYANMLDRKNMLK